MSAFVLVTGVLRLAPQLRTAKSGRVFATCQILAKDGENSALWNVIAFDATSVSELGRLREGDSIAAQGRLKVEQYEKDGAKKISLSLTAGSVLPLRRERRQSRPADARPRQERCAGQWRDARDGPDDSLDSLEAF